MSISPKSDSSFRDLERELAGRIEGEVRFDAGTRAVYSTDASNYRQIPVGVVIPRHQDDVERAVAICRRFKAAVLPRGAGTSLAGQGCNAAVIIDFSKSMNRILELDPVSRTAWVQPGVILDDLLAAAAKHGLTFGPDPSTHSRCTLGGMIGNNACGAHSVMAGKTSDNVESMEILTYDGVRLLVGRTDPPDLREKVARGGREGEIYSRLEWLAEVNAHAVRRLYPKIPRRVSGYNLDELLPEKGFHVARALVGSEGTCVTVLNARVRLITRPPARTLVLFGFRDIVEAAERAPDCMALNPIALEGLEHRLVLNQKTGQGREAFPELPPEGGWLLAEFGGRRPEESLDKAKRLAAKLKASPSLLQWRILESVPDQRRVWEVREAGVGATVFVPGQKDGRPGWEDSAVPPQKAGAYLRSLKKLLQDHGYRSSFYGHFGEGCLHARIDFDLVSPEGIRQYRLFMEEAAGLAAKFGGSLSGEHGDGQARAELLPKMFGPELVRAFSEFKHIWDPEDGMNPGKLVFSYRMDENLRYRTAGTSLGGQTHFAYTAEGGSFERALQRCVGTGKCRKTGGGTMCPSYMATREEKYSTRGRARLLSEMLAGEVVTKGWTDGAVKEALDLCLSCKACKRECPAGVDMAAYKAEFLAHYFEKKKRSFRDFMLGRIEKWVRLGSLAPGAANFFMRTPPFSVLAKSAFGISGRRAIPLLARETFRKRFAKSQGGHSQKPGVLLWVDAFHDCFAPETAEAAVRVLEWAGYRVRLAPENLSDCRVLFDSGRLIEARRGLGTVLKTLESEIAEDVPVVFLEPSSASVFHDELPALFPQDSRAARLSRRSYLIADFLALVPPSLNWPSFTAKALVHGHCHQKALGGMRHDLAILSAMGMEAEELDAGCCGMAGTFGLKNENYELSVRIAQGRLLPAIRQAGESVLLVVSGFGCREQIAQLTGRKAVHIIEVIDRALNPELYKGRP